MTFSNDKPIYIQMADRLCDEILADKYQDDDRIPSVREYSVLLEVNTNTAVKAYEQLAREEIIYNKRGLGYFVSADARDIIVRMRRQQLMQGEMDYFFGQLRAVGITPDDLRDSYQQFLTK